jgi:hypothetical protein
MHNGSNWVRLDLNQEPRDYESPALTVELWTQPDPSSIAGMETQPAFSKTVIIPGLG